MKKRIWILLFLLAGCGQTVDLLPGAQDYAPDAGSGTGGACRHYLGTGGGQQSAIHLDAAESDGRTLELLV